jgi:transcriptional regulator with XRE-family HTH domain
MADETERIGKRMRERRKELRGERGELSQRECAERMPGTVQASEWSRWERGKHRPEELDEVAKALETTVADLVAGPLAEREEPEDNDLMGKLNGRSAAAEAGDWTLRLDALENQLAAELAEVKAALAEQRSLLETVLRNQEAGG